MKQSTDRTRVVVRNLHIVMRPLDLNAASVPPSEEAPKPTAQSKAGKAQAKTRANK